MALYMPNGLRPLYEQPYSITESTRESSPSEEHGQQPSSTLAKHDPQTTIERVKSHCQSDSRSFPFRRAIEDKDDNMEPSPTNNYVYETPLLNNNVLPDEYAGNGMNSVREPGNTRRRLFVPTQSPLCLWVSSLPKKGGSPTGAERCIDASRRSLRFVLSNDKIVFLDLPQHEAASIPDWVLNALISKALLLNLNVCHTKEGNIKIAEGSGQAGIVLDDNENATLVTARHNISRDSKEEIVKIETNLALSPTDKLRTKFPQRKRACAKWRLRLREVLSWGYGWDVDSRPAILAHNDHKPGLTIKKPVDFRPEGLDQSVAFQKAENDYNYNVGDRIAVVVSRVGLTDAINQTTAKIVGWQGTDDPPSQLLAEIFGQEGGYAIYVGKITCVGRNHIEHDINSYMGCSGAIIFRWEPDLWKKHPENPVLPKAIAVHIGHHELVEQNIGLKLCRGPQLGLVESLIQTIALQKLPCHGAERGGTHRALKVGAAPSIEGPSQTDQETVPGLGSFD